MNHDSNATLIIPFLRCGSMKQIKARASKTIPPNLYVIKASNGLI